MNFQKALINWYSKHKRSLPWRETKDPYFIWLSEIMLQQTQVKQGLPYYEKFVKTYPTVFDLANATEENVLKNWQGLGYYSRARNLHFTAKQIAFELKGVFPSTYTDLIKLKGVGDYTASAIASICFNEPKAVLDGNVFRVLARYFNIPEAINSPAGLKIFKELSQSLIVHKKPGTYNQAIMEFGARQCKPVNPNCGQCPLSDSCAALKSHTVGNLPVKLKNTKVQKKYFNYFVFIDPKGHIKLEKRSSKGIWQNLYQFPLLESDSSLSSSSFPSLISKFDIESKDIKDYFLFKSEDIVHKLSHRTLFTKFWIILLKTDLKEGIPFETIASYPMPVLIANFLNEFDFKKV